MRCGHLVKMGLCVVAVAMAASLKLRFLQLEEEALVGIANRKHVRTEIRCLAAMHFLKGKFFSSDRRNRR